MYCEKCGADNSETAVYCGKCGVPIAEEETRVAARQAEGRGGGDIFYFADVGLCEGGVCGGGVWGFVLSGDR